MEVKLISQEQIDSFKNEIIREISKLLKGNTSAEMKTWLRTRDVCELLNLSTSSLQNLRNAGKIPYKKLNGTLLYRREDIEAMLDSLSNEGGTDL